MAIDTTNTLDLAALGLRSSTDASGVKKKELGQEDFLKLMITQFRNQDPFKPMENGEFLGQLAQFSSVAGLTELKQSFADLSTSLMSNQTLQASSLLGRKVLVEGDAAALSTGGSVSGVVELTNSVSGLRVQIVDSSGAVVRQLGLGPQGAGQVPFNWDGKKQDGSDAAPGMYTVRAQIITGPNTQESAKTLMEGTVDSVTMGAGQTGLTLSLGPLGEVALADVRKIS